MIHAILQTENVVVYLRKAQIGVGLLILRRLTKLGPQSAISTETSTNRGLVVIQASTYTI